ncbi:MAG TPA: lipid II flippase MurJ [Chloroflexia bacterium]|nr:lipid II flippase MurJ [Chloroflexia bacterium]
MNNPEFKKIIEIDFKMQSIRQISLNRQVALVETQASAFPGFLQQSLLVMIAFIYSGLFFFLVSFSSLLLYGFYLLLGSTIVVCLLVNKQAIKGFRVILPYLLWILFYSVWGLLVTPYPGVVFPETLRLILRILLVTGAVVVALSKLADISRLSFYIQLAAILNCLVSIWENADPFLTKQIADSLNSSFAKFSGYRPAGLWADPNEAAYAFIFALLLSRFNKGIFAWVGRFASIIGVYMSVSRSGTYLLVLCLVILFVTKVRKIHINHLTIAITSFIVAFILASLLLLVSTESPKLDLDFSNQWNISRLLDFSETGAQNNSAFSRGDLTLDGLNYALEGEWYGYGIFSFQGYGELSAVDSSTLMSRKGVGAHDIYVVILGEIGLFGLFLYLLVMALGFANTCKTTLESSHRLTMLLLWLVYLLIGLVLHLLFTSYTLLIYLALLYRIPQVLKPVSLSQAKAQSQSDRPILFKPAGKSLLTPITRNFRNTPASSSDFRTIPVPAKLESKPEEIVPLIGSIGFDDTSYTTNINHCILAKLNQIGNKSINRQILSAAVVMMAIGCGVKFLSLLKEGLTSSAYGTGDAVDAFLIAYLIPNFVMSVLATPFTAALIPAYIQVKEQEGSKAAQKLFSAALTAGTILLSLVTLALALCGPLILGLIGAGFSQQKLTLTCELFYILLPIIVLNGLAVIWTAVLNAEEKFATSTIVPVVIPLSLIVFLIFFRESFGIFALAYATLLGTVLQTGLLYLCVVKQRISFHFCHPRNVPALSQVIKQYRPLLIGAFLLGSTGLMDQTMCALLAPGSVAALSYGSKLTSLISGIVSVALSTAVFPYLSRMAVASNWQGVKNTLVTYSKLILAGTFTGVVILGLMSEFLVKVLYERGAFNASDTSLVSNIQIMYVLQLPFYTLAVFFSRAISSLQTNQILLRGTIISCFLNLIFDLALMKVMGVPGIALSTTLIYMISSIYLGFMTYRQLMDKTGKQKKRASIRVIARFKVVFSLLHGYRND